jgi:hypothetical protein
MNVIATEKLHTIGNFTPPADSVQEKISTSAQLGDRLV